MQICLGCTIGLALMCAACDDPGPAPPCQAADGHGAPHDGGADLAAAQDDLAAAVDLAEPARDLAAPTTDLAAPPRDLAPPPPDLSGPTVTQRPTRSGATVIAGMDALPPARDVP
jgi:hypothetical protein